jgi:hypothetical protein
MTLCRAGIQGGAAQGQLKDLFLFFSLSGKRSLFAVWPQVWLTPVRCGQYR